jgi:hypothetical protein
MQQHLKKPIVIEGARKLFAKNGIVPYKVRGIWDPVYKKDMAIRDISQLKLNYK